MKRMSRMLCLLFFVQPVSNSVYAQNEISQDTKNIIYGRKFGMALTMDVFQPTTTPNEAAVVIIVSGGYRSAPFDIWPPNNFYDMTGPFLNRGFTVFAVTHGSSPVFSIPDILEDVKLSIRYIRANSISFNVDRDRIGVLGFSSGANLALSLGMMDDDGSSQAENNIDRFSSKANAVVAFYAPTDYLNFGEPGVLAEDAGLLGNGGKPAPFDFHEVDPVTGHYIPISDSSKRLEIIKNVSPIYDVSEDDPPVLLLHGDADPQVPIQQSLSFYERLLEAEVESALHIEKNGGHGRWGSMPERLQQSATWFVDHLID